MASMLELIDVSLKRHGNTLLQPLTLQLPPAQLCVILGPNGAGKSTLLQLMSGYLTPDSGSVCLAGQPVHRLNAAKLAQLRAVVEQQSSCPAGWTAGELVRTGLYHAPQALHVQALEQALALSCTDHLLDRPMHSLSGGELQRIHLARALCQILASTQPERYLLLDEATAAMDFAIADAMMLQLRHIAETLSLGVVMVLHDLNLAMRHADQVLLLQDGHQMAFGTVADIMQKEQLEAIYGIRLTELISPDASIRAFVPHSPGLD